MWYPAKPTGATVEPVTLDEAKRQARVMHNDDDAHLTHLIAAARDHVERYTGAAWAQQAVEVMCDGWSDLSRLPVFPVQSVVIEYVDAAGDEQTLPGTVYEFRPDAAAVVLRPGQQWPATAVGTRISVTAVVGGATPPSVKHAILMLLSDLNENREIDAADARTTLDNLLANHRFY